MHLCPPTPDTPHLGRNRPVLRPVCPSFAVQFAPYVGRDWFLDQALAPGAFRRPARSVAGVTPVHLVHEMTISAAK